MSDLEGNSINNIYAPKIVLSLVIYLSIITIDLFILRNKESSMILLQYWKKGTIEKNIKILRIIGVPILLFNRIRSNNQEILSVFFSFLYKQDYF